MPKPTRGICLPVPERVTEGVTIVRLEIREDREKRVRERVRVDVEEKKEFVSIRAKADKK